MRVLILSHGLHRTGAPKIVLDAMKAMRDKVEVFTVSPEDGPFAEQFSQLGPLFLKHKNRTLREMVWQRLVGNNHIQQIKRHIMQWKPDLVYVNSVEALPLLNDFAPADTPVLLHVHEMSSYLEYWRNRPEFRERPVRYIAVSEAVAEALITYCGVSPERVSVIHEFICENEYSEFIPGTAGKNPNSPWIVGGAGSSELRKGHVLWLQMAAALTASLGKDQIRFVWVGLGDDTASRQIRVLAKQYGLEDVVTFIPATSEPLKHFAGFDIFAMTSWEDPCPVVVLENMMLGNPVACFAGSGGAPEEVGETGMIAEDFSPQKMAKLIAEMLKTPESFATASRLARARVQNKFSRTIQAPKIWNEMERAVEGHSEHAEAVIA